MLILAGDGQRIFYAALKPTEGEKTLEFGILDPEAAKLLHLVDLGKAVDEIWPLASAPDGSRCCMPVEWRDHTFSLLLVSREGGAVQRYDLPEQTIRPGGVAFAANSQSLWVIAIQKRDGGEPGSQVAIERVHPDRGVEQRRVLPFDEEGIDDDNAVALIPALSPDGRWLAISTFLFEEEPASRLMLVDLESSDLACKIITPPVAAEQDS
jgi:hypothetical protein